MEVRSLTYDLLSKQWSEPIPKLDSDQTLVLAFGSPELDLQREGLARLRAALPRATLLGCSGAGEIAGRDVRDDALIVTVTRFAHTRLKSARVSVSDRAESYAAGQTLAKYLAGPDLRAVFVLSEGLQVNGTELVRGMNDHLPAAVVVTGGLAGDGSRFERTWVAHDDLVGSGVIAAVGLYGDHVRVGHGSKGGWDRFGPERTVTRADGNVLYELDGKPALALYKQYLGPKAADLPASGLLFPLAIRSGTTDDKVLVRTVLAVDEATQSMTFAGDVPTGSLAQLMKADFDRLVTGAESAATSARTRQLGAHPAEFGEPEVDGPMLAVAISCVGRRMVLGDRTEEEIEAISDVLPPGANITGFYSYGELSPHANGRCDLHNQTMTITTFAEVEALPAVDDDTVVRSGFEVRTVHYDLKTRAWSQPLPSELDAPRTLVVAFGSPIIGERHPEVLQALRKAFRRSVVVGCSGAGEIVGGEVRDGVVTVAVARFGKTDLAATAVDVPEAARSYDVGRLLATGLARPDLRAVFVLSDGLGVNGTDLVHGLNDNLDPSVVVTGGLAGDGTRFQKTWVLYGDEVRAGRVVAVGLYGEYVSVGHGSQGGWDRFGPARRVTRSTGNVVFEIDGRPALALYKEYLGPKASELPSSGLLFPLAMQDGDSEKVLVRTLLAVDEQAQSLTFAGDVPQGASVQLMKADFDRLVGGAVGAASMVNSTTRGSNLTKLAIAVSCVGRRLVLGERTDDEIEAVRENLPPKTSLVGFYSYGELSPHGLGSCDLHNQTMTLTTFGESAIPLPKRTPAPAPARRAQTPLAPATDPLPQSTTPSTPTPAPATHTGGDGRLRVETFTWTGSKWSVPVPPQLDSPRTLVLAFGPRSLMDAPEPLRALSRVYPLSHVVGCSGAGQIVAGDVSDDALTVLVARFARTDLVSATAEVTDASQSHAAGLKLSRDLAAPDLRAVFVLSEGLTVNGSELVRGLNEGLGIDKGQIVLTGGLAGDGTRFERTWVLHGGEARSGLVVAVGFYGDHIVVGHGSKGGWDKFGPERVVTRSAGNVLYSLDGRPALGLYKEYLGPRAKDLPSSGLLFPLAMRSGPNDDKVLVRTVLAVDEAAQSMTFAGDLPEGSLVQLMKADFDRLVSGAEGAARDARALAPAVDSASFAVAVSCVGRRLVLADRTEEEVEAVANVLPKGAAVVGFYSYGELSPYGQGACDLHNQTMTLTTFAESAQPLARGANPMARSAPPAPERPLEARARATPPPSVPPAAAPQKPAPPPSRTELTAGGTGSGARQVRPTVVRVSGDHRAVPLELGRRTIGGIEIVSVAGRLTETFAGEQLGRGLKGTVVLDLGRVDRITSFGVREWLAMLREAKVDRLYLARCSEPVVNQLTMIRGFAGDGKVLSFFAPYLCGSCGTAYSAQLDAERDRASIDEVIPPETHCPRCGSPGAFDDDAGSYFSLSGLLVDAVPADVRKVLSSLEPLRAGDALEKVVDGRNTRLLVNAPVDPALRWNKALDGIEGPLTIDFTRAASANAAGGASLERALRAVASDVTELSLAAVPRPVLEALAGASGLPKWSVTSVLTEAHCASCAAQRSVLVPIKDHGGAIRAGRDPDLTCPRCGGRLSFERSRDLLGLALDVKARPSAPPSPAPRPAPAAPVVEASPRTGFATLGVVGIGGALGGALILAMGLALGVMLYVGVTGRPAAAPPPDPAPAEAAPAGQWTGAHDLPPAWVERPVAMEVDRVVVVGQVAGQPTDVAALAAARDHAVVRLLQQVLQDLRDEPVGAFVAERVSGEPAPDEVTRIAARYLEQSGAIGTPERVDVALRTTPAGTEGYVQYALPKASYDAVVAKYRETGRGSGITVARYFPLLAGSLRNEAELMVIDATRLPTRAGVLVGDGVASVAGQGVTSPTGFDEAATAAWNRAEPGTSFEVVLESNLTERAVKITKPKED